MASATGVPENNAQPAVGEEEPLLGRAGDASQKEGYPLYYNLFIGTAVVAQAGIILFVALIWAGVFIHPPLSLFSGHPLFNSAGILLLVESVLLLQPTHTAGQKRYGAISHFMLNNTALNFMISAFVIIEYNKFDHGANHFESIHGKLGLITYCLLIVQGLIGTSMYFVPRLFGGEDNAKQLYKWHRLSGYVILVMMLATACAATQTYTGMYSLQIKLWAVLVSSVMILIGILPRIKKQKFGFGTA